jgi:ubiquinone/menaquinone biosynthesis C-methylase UbiE/glycosyltransferase involved in cell wall biosynthesis
MSSIVNLITKDTTKKQMKAAYSQYPDTMPNGITPFNHSTVEPMVCEIPDGSSVLDVGCNSGEMMLLLKEKKCRVVGVDVSDVALKIAKEKGLRVFNASAEKLPFKDNRFDVVVLREVLIHIHEPLKALKEIRRVLKPTGFMIGSVPHANLERIVWDDKRLHHRYYYEETLKKDLHEYFDTIHLNILTGAQFSITFANSLLMDKPAEMLFKCGNKDTFGWEHALKSDKKTLRVWLGPTQPPGCVYYRMTGFAEKMRAMKGVEIAYERFDYNQDSACSEWQRKLIQNEYGDPVSSLALNHFEKAIMVANPSIFQITYYEDILDLFRSIKEAYPDKKLVTECDDWLFDVPAYNIASNPYKPGSEKERVAYEQIELSDAVIASTSFIKEGLQNFFPEKKIYVVPNSLDFNVWDNLKGDGKCEPKKEGVIRIGFSGCGNHNGDLEIVKPVLLSLLEEFPNLEIIMSGYFECFKDIKDPRFMVPGRWVNIHEFPNMVAGWNLDIGIAPLRDNNFNRAKSNLRWLEYSALQIPTVASNVRPFKESFIEGIEPLHHDNILLASSKEDWYSKLKTLIQSGNLRYQYGQSAYKDVKERFNMDKTALFYKQVLEEIRHAGQ